MAITYIGIGSNIGDTGANCARAVSLLKQEEDIALIASSSFYLTSPEGGPSQDEYLNGVVKISSDMFPKDLLALLKDIENDMGREPSGRDHPRVIDMDILLYGDEIISAEGLIIPHPRMHKRLFVLQGLAELDPELKHPVLGKTVQELYNEVQEKGLVHGR